MARSSMPNMLDYNKQANDIMKNQVDLMGKKADLIGKEPTGFEAEQELFKNIKAGVEGKRKPAYQTIIEGLMNGVQYGMQKKQIEAQKEKYGKINKVLDYFDQTATDLARQNQENMRKENERVKIEPYAKTALELAYNGGDYASTDQAMQNIFKELKATNPQIKGDLVGYIPNTPVLNIRDAEGNIKPLNLTQFVNEDTLKRVQDNFQSQQANDARMKSADASMMRAEVDAAYAPIHAASREAYAQNIQNTWNPLAQYEKGFGAKQGQEEAKRIGELENQNLHLEDKKWQIKELQDMLKGDKVITGQTISSWLSRATGKQFNTEKMSETEAFDALSKNLLGFVKGDVKFGNMNQKEFEWLAKQTPDSTMTPGGIKRILDRLETSIDRAVTRNEREMNRRPNYNKMNPRDVKTDPTQNPPTETDKKDVGNNTSYIKMQRPDGNIVAVLKDSASSKLKQGYKYLK